MFDNQDYSNRYDRMLQAPIPSLISRLAAPPIVTMLVTSIYSMADTYFVSHLGTSAAGAIGVVFALMALIQAIGFMLGMGAGTFLSRMLGQKNIKVASQAASTSFFSALFLGMVFTLTGLGFLPNILVLLGSTPTILPFAEAYASVILLGAPFMMASFVMNNVLRAQGNALYSMIGIATGSLLNIVLDPIFIFLLNRGIQGAAEATLLSQLTSFSILLYFTRREKEGARINWHYFYPKFSIYYEILRNGLPSFNRQTLASLATIILNWVAGPFGDAAIAAMSIVARFVHFLVAAMLGFAQGFMPVAGFNYGAQRFDRVLESFWFSLKVTTLFFLITGFISAVNAQNIISAFRKEDLEVIFIGSQALRYQSLILPLQGWIIMTSILTQTIGKSWQASILSMSRQGFFFIPLIIILPYFFGLLGMVLAQPLADLLTSLAALKLILPVLRSLKSPEIMTRSDL